jgi:hypothetical protein
MRFPLAIATVALIATTSMPNAKAQLLDQKDLSLAMALTIATGAPRSTVGLSGSPGVDEECVNAGIEKVSQSLQ